MISLLGKLPMVWVDANKLIPFLDRIHTLPSYRSTQIYQKKKKKKKKTNQCIYSNLTTPDLIRFFPSRSLRNKHAVNKRIPQKSMDKQVDRKMVGMYKCMHLPMYNQLLHYIL